MRKLLNNPWFVTVVAVVALLLLGNSLRSARTGQGFGFATAANPTGGGTSSAVGEMGEGEVPVNMAAQDALQALPVPARVSDPFAPRARHEQEPEKAPEPDQVDRVHLTAIWTQNDATLVLINDRICQAGDEIGRIKIDTTAQEGVWVSHWKGRDFINLGDEFELRTPAGRLPATDPTQKAL
jgi:hypothetical protein